MKKDYSEAYSEVLEVIKYIPKEDYNKIPPKMIQLFKSNCDENSEFTYNVALPFEKQNLSKDAKLILAIIFRNCWITLEQKRELSVKEKEHLEKIENEKREKYNPDEIFKKRETQIKKELEENHFLEVVKEEKWYKKLWSRIKNIFK